MDGMYAGFAGAKTDHGFTALAKYFTLTPFLRPLSTLYRALLVLNACMCLLIGANTQ